MGIQLVPGRVCGPCTVCCKEPPIIEAVLKKPPGVLCPHCRTNEGCTIYEDRPGTCRSHFCAWRLLPQFDESWRPDLSNIYIELKGDPPEHFRHVLPEATFAFKFTILAGLDAARLESLATAVAGLVEYDLPVILAVAAPPEHLGCRMLLNPSLKPFAADAGQAFFEAFAAALHSCSDFTPVKAAVG